jgi:hypothetical protein
MAASTAATIMIANCLPLPSPLILSTSHLPMNRNPLLVLTSMLITASIQFVLMGLLAEILVRIYHESQDRPIYVIEKIFESNVKENL